jgi:tetratricopeptide (TPR) repeat protein
MDMEEFQQELMRGIELYKKAQFRQALNIFVEQLHLIEKNAGPDQYVNFLDIMANCHINLAEFDKAVDYLDQSLKIYKDLYNIHKQAHILQMLANSLNAAGRPEESVEYIKQSIEINRTLDNQLDLANNLVSLAIIQSEMKTYDQAFGNLGDALSIFEKEQDIDGVLLSLNHMGNLYLENPQI